MNIEELLKRQPEVLRSLNRGATRAGTTPKLDMHSRFMNFKNLKQKYGQRLAQSGRSDQVR